MKRLLSFFFCIGTFAAFCQTPRYDTIRYAKKHYQKRVARFENEPVQKGRIIFLGNSITEFADWKKLLNDTTVVNRGIAADNTFGVLDRLEDVIVRQPRKLFIEVGINDISQQIPINIIAKNIYTIVERLKSKSPGTEVYVVSLLPTNDKVAKEYPELFHKNEEANKVNTELQRSASSRFTYIDLNQKLRDKGGNLDPQFAKDDGLHLNAAGYQVWISLLKSKGYL